MKYSTIRMMGIILLALVTLLIFVFSLMPASQIEQMVDFMLFADFGAHMLAYTAFGFCFFLSIAKLGQNISIGRRIREVSTVMICGLLLGILIEILQPLVQRSSQLPDVLADVIGTALGISIAALFIAYFQNIDARKQ